MHVAEFMQRPSTAKRFQQMEDDEELARQWAMEEDEKIAKKFNIIEYRLQADYEAGIANDEYHRLGTAKRLADEFQLDGDAEFGKAEPPATTRKTRPPSAGGERKRNAEEGRMRSDYKSKDSMETRSNLSSSPIPNPTDKLFDKDESSEYPESDRIVKHAEQSSPDPSELESNISNDIKSNAISYSANLKKDIQNLLDLIDVYKPDVLAPEYRLEPFIPDLIPCIGDIDPMLQIPSPPLIESKSTKQFLPDLAFVSLKFLDEPNIEQSDPASVDFELRSFYVGQKLGRKAETKIRSIQIEGENTSSTKAIQSWLKTVSDNYSARQSELASATQEDIEHLMAQWPEELDVGISQQELLLPDCDIDLSLKAYAKILCLILDIPIYESKDKRLNNRAHVDAVGRLCMLYSGFKNSHHFGRN